MKIRIINGPNINMLGIRETHIYGKLSYNHLLEQIAQFAKEHDLSVEILQSNHEGELIDWIQAIDTYDALVVNFGGYSHTSIAIMDALLAIKSVNKYIVEVHISNVHARDEFRINLFSAKACDALISGCGINGYLLALRQIMDAVDFRKCGIDEGITKI